jgi:hypothetical protein
MKLFGRTLTALFLLSTAVMLLIILADVAS